MAFNSAKILQLDITVDFQSYEEGLRKVFAEVKPNWRPKETVFETLTQGFANRVVLCKDDRNRSDWAVARIFGTDMKQCVNHQRETEIECSKLLGQMKISPLVLGTFTNGIIFNFVPGMTFSWTDLSPLRVPKIANALAIQLARLHSKLTLKRASNMNIDKGKTLFDTISQVVETFPDEICDEEITKCFKETMPNDTERKEEMKKQMEKIKAIMGPDMRICHGDCNPTNMIYNKEENRMILVDLEASGLGSPYLDLCCFLSNSAVGFAPDPEGLQHTPEYHRLFIKTYLTELYRLDEPGRVVDTDEVERLYMILLAMGIGFQFFMHIMFVPMAVDCKQNPRPGFSDYKFFIDASMKRYEYYQRHRDEMYGIMDELIKEGGPSS